MKGVLPIQEGTRSPTTMREAISGKSTSRQHPQQDATTTTTTMTALILVDLWKADTRSNNQTRLSPATEQEDKDCVLVLRGVVTQVTTKPSANPLVPIIYKNHSILRADTKPNLDSYTDIADTG